eukprot:4650781-Prymnesium_polylepis.1
MRALCSHDLSELAPHDTNLPPHAPSESERARSRLDQSEGTGRSIKSRSCRSSSESGSGRPSACLAGEKRACGRRRGRRDHESPLVRSAVWCDEG